MYHVRLKRGSYKYDKKGGNFGLNLDEWLYVLLDNLSFGPEGCVIINPTKCFYKPSPINNLYLKSGTFIKVSKSSKAMFNLEEHIVRTLISYGIMTESNYTDYCCKYKTKVNIYKEVVYFERGAVTDRSGVLRKWLNAKLTEWSIPFTDPCCL